MNDIEVFNAVTAVFWNRSVQDSIVRLKAAGDAAVPCVLSEIAGAAEGRVGAPNWWDGAVQLCGVLEEAGTPVAKDALLTVLAMDSRFVEFDRVRASAAKCLSSFSDSAPDLVPKLIELLDSPHAPLAQIQSAIDELGGEAPVTPELLIEKAAYMDPAKAIQHLGAYQKQAAGWNPDQRRHFFWLLGNKVDAAFRHHGPKDGDLATRLSRPYHAAALLADPSPDVTSWTKFGVIAVERSEERAKLLAAQYPLLESPPIPSESDALGGT